MKRIKDFIYNTSDILVATVILVAAIGLIFWRMQIILDYPTHLFGDKESVITEPTVTPVTDPVTDPAVSEDPIEVTEPEDPIEVTEPEDPIEEDTPLWENGMLTREITVTVTGSTATAAIQCLVDVGIYDDFADFDESCKRTKRNHNNVRGGVKTFDRGMTKDEITKEVTFVIK